MANVVYNETETISNSISYSADIVVRSLNSALSDSIVTLPNDFSYLEFAMKLPSAIDELVNEMNAIYNVACYIDTSYRTMNDNMINSNQNIEIPIIKERNRLIYK